MYMRYRNFIIIIIISFLIVEYTVQFIPWTKTKFSNLSVSDVAKISKILILW
jgi:uncharacterized sodium:solute symporter family permease YidK